VTTRTATRRAEQVLAEMGTIDAPIPVEAIAQRVGLNVVFQDLPRDTSAVIIRTSDGHRVIAVNASHSLTRQRFSIAHEIAHALLHLPADPPASGDAVVDKPIEVLFRDGIAAMGVDKREIEANAFAGELLMPAKGLRERFRELLQVSSRKATEALVRELAADYEVSTQAMGYRLANLNLIDPA
jgi:Zn-dependent peptidase ImmA (M78 family)